MIYLGDNWPDRYRDSLFTCNLHGRRVNNDRLARQDRYAWFVSDGASAHDPRTRLDAKTVLDGLDDRMLLRLYRKSMAVDSRVPRFEPG